MRTTLYLFCRAPEPGAVKTRLARTIGDAAAARLYAAFLADVCATAAGVGDAGVLAVAGDAAHPALRALAEAHGYRIEPQVAGDLGARMAAALAAGQAGGGAAIVIGSDAPLVPRADLVEARRLLADHPVVLGPATDGGYWLLGARRPVPEILSGMAWSTSGLLAETLSRLRGERVGLLPFHYDVDEAADLALLRAHLDLLPAAVAPATRRALLD
jgi:hypothetical protein